jgi:hypothetical protein
MKYVSFQNKESAEYKRGFEAGKKSMEKVLKLSLSMQNAIFAGVLEMIKRQKAVEEQFSGEIVVPYDNSSRKGE